MTPIRSSVLTETASGPSQPAASPPPKRTSATVVLLATILLATMTTFPAAGEEDADVSYETSEIEGKGIFGPLGLDPYVEYNAGATFILNQTIRGDSATGTGLWGRSEQETAGYVLGGAIGTELLEHFRAELNLSFRSSKVEDIAVQSEPSNAKGDVSLFSVMANGYFDFDPKEFLGVDFPVIPYIGAGIGWGLVRLDAQNQAGALQLALDDTDSVWVYNAMVGGTVPISEVASASLGYRYVGTGEITFASRSAGAAQRMEYEFDAHEIVAGLRFSF